MPGARSKKLARSKDNNSSGSEDDSLPPSLTAQTDASSMEIQSGSGTGITKPEQETVETSGTAPTPDKAEEEEEAAAEDEFTVEAIINKRTIGGKIKYLIKWEGFDDAWNTWEPLENLGCPEILEEFEKNWKAKKSQERKKRGPKIILTPSSGANKRNRGGGGQIKQENASNTQSTTFSKTPLAKLLAKESEDGKFSEDEDAVPQHAAYELNVEDIVASSSKSINKSVLNVLVPEDEEMVGLERNLQPYYIVGMVKDESQQLYFIVIWKGSEKGDFVPVEDFCEKFPYFAIDYFECHRVWEPGKFYEADDSSDSELSTRSDQEEDNTAQN